MYYDYFTAVTDDVREYIQSHNMEVTRENRDEIEQNLHDDLFCYDGITGNGSGSYTFNRMQAAEYLSTNFDLLAEACDAFGGYDIIKQGPEACDVTIRCYLLPQAIAAVLDEIEEAEE